MQTENRTDVNSRLYNLAYAAAQLVAWLLMLAAMWRFIIGEFRHPISLLGTLIDRLGLQRPAGYWMDAPPSWDHAFAPLEWIGYYLTGLCLYAVAGTIVMGIFIGLDRLMMPSQASGD